jgi:hypothetical protein
LFYAPHLFIVLFIFVLLTFLDCRMGNSVVSGYEIRGFIAKGGQAKVYEAYHIETGQTYAIKVLEQGDYYGQSEVRRRRYPMFLSPSAA